MKIIASTLKGINPLELKKEFDRALNAGINIIQFEISTGIKFPPGPFGEYMIANVAGWTNLCISTHLIDFAGPRLIENVIACGTDIVIIPSKLLTEDAIRLVHNLGAILSVESYFDIIEDSESFVSNNVEMVYLNQSEISSPSQDWGNQYLKSILKLQQHFPKSIIAGKISTNITFTSNIAKIINNLDIVTIDFFKIKNAVPLIDNINSHSSPTIHPILSQAIPHGLTIKRDQERVKSIFESIDAQFPPRRQQ